jgi:hypothetical protein
MHWMHLEILLDEFRLREDIGRKPFGMRANLLADPINCTIMQLLAFHQHLNVFLVSPDIGASI